MCLCIKEGERGREGEREREKKGKREGEREREREEGKNGGREREEGKEGGGGRGRDSETKGMFIHLFMHVVTSPHCSGLGLQLLVPGPTLCGL